MLNPKRLIKRIKQKLYWSHRLYTSNRRSLPNLIIIGAQKAGTTSLFYYLSQHPQLVPSIRKEVHYFDGGLDPTSDDFLRGEKWYRAHFPRTKEIKSSDVVFEATPSYLYHPEVPNRIHDLIPSVKMIALLRNPTERAISQYFHEKRKNQENLPIMDALLAEEDRLKLILERKNYKDSAFFRFSYKLRGHYYEQLNRFFNYFEQNQLLILSSEYFFQNTRKALEQISHFLGIDMNLTQYDLEPKHVSKNKVEVDREVYQYLNDYFKPYNERLYDLIGVDFGW